MTLAVLLAVVGSAVWAATRPADVVQPVPASSVMPPTLSSSPTPTPSPPPQPGYVAVEQGAASAPDASVVRSVLERHFRAINDKDYDAWAATVTSRRAQDEPPASWHNGYRTTSNTDIVLRSLISTGSDSVIAVVSFTSMQDPADAPASMPVDRICWAQQLPIENLGTSPRIGVPARGTTSMEAC